jgi:metal-responsive CopG/Arc/MetJ family transcriptional regulator
VLRVEIEGWAKKQKGKPSRSEAIRQLIELALALDVGKSDTRAK